MKKILFLAIFVMSFPSCSQFLAPSKEEMKYFLIQLDSREENLVTSSHDKTLLISDATTNSFLQSRKMITAEGPRKRSYYQFARWVEAPPRLMLALIEESIRREGIVDSVTLLPSAVVGDLQLNIQVKHFEHLIAEPPGRVKAEVQVDLIDLKSRNMVSSRTFSETEPVEYYSGQGAADAFNVAVNRMVEELVLWLEESLKPTPAKP